MHTENRFGTFEKYGLWIVAAAVLVGLHIAGRYNYLIFHTIVEVFTVVVACGIFMLAWNSRGAHQNDYLLFLGTAYLFVAGLDLLHTLTYEGINVFPGHGTDLATQLWIGARYMEGLSLLLAPLLAGRRIRAGVIFACFTVVTALLLMAILHWRIFPVCFDAGNLTGFKKTSEYVITGMLLASVALLLRKRASFDRDVLRMIVASIVLTAASELSFTLYRDAYDIANEIGHLLKLASFYLIYRAVIQTGIRMPFKVLLRDLKKSNERLESRNRELQTFARILRHDLGNPLFSVEALVKCVDTYCSRIGETLQEKRLDRKRKEEMLSILTEDIPRSLESVRTSVQMMKKMLDGLGQVATVGYRTLNVSPVDMNALLEEIVSTMAPKIAESEVSVSVDGLPPCQGDPVQLTEAFSNLLSNAIKYRNPNRKGRIRVFGRRQDSMSIYCVEDNGLGIAPEHREKVFELFHRINPDGPIEGEGLGLSIVQKLIERHQGRVWLESDPGKTTRFFVAVPCTTIRGQ